MPENPSNKKYHEGLCEQLVAFMAQGKSFLAFGGKVRVGKTTLYNWAQRYPEFKEAWEIGEAAYREYWENLNAMGGAGIEMTKKDKDGKEVRIKPNPAFVTFTLARKLKDFREHTVVEDAGAPSRLIIDFGDEKEKEPTNEDMEAQDDNQ